jgi:hypothetical protein
MCNDQYPLVVVINSSWSSFKDSLSWSRGTTKKTGLNKLDESFFLALIKLQLIMVLFLHFEHFQNNYLEMNTSVTCKIIKKGLLFFFNETPCVWSYSVMSDNNARNCQQLEPVFLEICQSNISRMWNRMSPLAQCSRLSASNPGVELNLTGGWVGFSKRL